MDTTNTDNYEPRINEILFELGECREDERNSKVQMLQVISTAGVIIGACFGLSSLFPNIGQFEESLETLNHIILFLTGCILCTAFPYIIFLGIGDVLRFHYMRSLEDQLSQMISEYTGQEAMMHWMSASAPILTKNPQHIMNTRYTIGAYLSYTIAAIAAVAFGLCTIWMEFDRIEECKWYDYVVAISSITIILLSFVLFVIISYKARDMFNKSLTISKKQRTERLNPLTETKDVKSLKEKYRDIFHVVIYYIYPKRKDFQKLLLIPLGAVVGIFIFNGLFSLDLIKVQLENILTVIIVIDVLIYQSRYQLNDICGRKEDQKTEKGDRLPVQFLGEERAIKWSIFFIIIKVILAIYICLVGHYRYLWVFMALIGIVAVLYEFARLRQYNRIIFILVGFGYPLRFFSGLWAVWPNEQISSSSWCLLLVLFVAYVEFGRFSALLPWTHEAVSEKINGKHEFAKSYYEPLYTVVKSRCNNGLNPLNEKGNIKDPWNLAYIISICVLTLFAACFLLFFSPILAFIEAICGIVIISVYRKSSINVLKHILLISGLIMVKGIISFFALGWLPWYVCICAHQLFFMAVYYFIRFSFTPDYNFFSTFFSFIWKEH